MERRRQGDNGGRDWSDESVNLGRSRIAGNRQKLKERLGMVSSSESPEEPTLRHIDLRLLTSLIYKGIELSQPNLWQFVWKF